MCFKFSGGGDPKQEGVLAIAVRGYAGGLEGRKGGHQRLEEMRRLKDEEGVVAMRRGKGASSDSAGEMSGYRME